MKKTIFLGFLAVLLAFGPVIGCSSDSSDDPAEAGQSQESQGEQQTQDEGQTYQPLVIRGRIGDRNVETIISTTRIIGRTVLTPRTGDSYDIRYINPIRVISQGTIVMTPTGTGD